MKIIVHLGAHKTATTFIQNCIKINEQALLKNGVAYIHPTAMRTKLNNCFLPAKFDVEKIKITLSNYFSDDTQRLIISEENLMGIPKQIKRGKVYTFKENSIKNIQKTFENHEIEFVLTVRSYADFLPSIYMEFLKMNKFCWFRNFIKNLDLDSFSWTSQVSEIDAMLKPGNTLTVFKFEEIKHKLKDFYSYLIGGDQGAENFDDTIFKRASFKKEVLVQIPKWEKQFGLKVSRQIAKKINKVLIKNNAGSKFIPWTANELQQLKHKYNEDEFGESYKLL